MRALKNAWSGQLSITIRPYLIFSAYIPAEIHIILAQTVLICPAYPARLMPAAPLSLQLFAINMPYIVKG